jgi:beta-N-acetylhexosaminidase
MHSGRLMQIGLYHGNREKSTYIIKKIRPVSIIIMGNDFNGKEDLFELIKWIKSIYTKDLKMREPLIAVDQEGGNVARIRDINYSPGNFALGMLNKKSFSYYSGAITGSELRDLGFHWDLAPVLDVLSNMENTSVLERSFGEYVNIVAENGAYFIRGLQDYGISATGKHFPGNGSVVEDPHERLPVDRRGIDSVKNTMVPFKRAIDEGVKSIMVSHVLFESIDPDFPSSLSRKVYEILRRELGFRGLILTDSLDMKAISNNFTPEEIVKGSYMNGADILECVDPDLALEIHDVLEKTDSGNIEREERLNDLYIDAKKKARPPEEIMSVISYSIPKWIRKMNLDPDRRITINYIGSTGYFPKIIERIRVRLENIGIDVEILDKGSTDSQQMIIIGKNLHLNGMYKHVNEICKGKKCVFINTGIPYDSLLLDDTIGYVAAMGDKYENVLSSIYAIIGFNDLDFF